MGSPLRASAVVPIGPIGPTAKKQPPIGAIGAIGCETNSADLPPNWSVVDWLVYREERLSIRLYDGGMPEAEAAHGAWLDCIAQWLERRPPPSGAQAAWTGTPEEFRLSQIAGAIRALSLLGIHDEAQRLALRWERKFE